MIWFLTKRNIVYKLHKAIWNKNLPWFDAITFQRNGIPRKYFEDMLFGEEFGYRGRTYYFKSLYKKLKGGKHYAETFTSKVKFLIEQCIDDEYIKKDGIGGAEKLFVRGKGVELIKLSYFPKIFFGNAYVKAIIIWGFTFYLTSYITENIINKVNNPAEIIKP